MKLALMIGLFFTAGPPAGAIRVVPAEVGWKAAPPNLPAGTKVAVLEGDPKQKGLFTMRVELPGGATVKPHTHPAAERVTVLSGAIDLCYEDCGAKTRLPAGSYYVTPPGVLHALTAVGDTVIQLTNEGPWKVDFK